MMAEASVLDSLNVLIRKKVKTEKVQSEDMAPSLFDNVYSFAKKRGLAGGAKVSPQKGPQQQQHQISFQGTSQHLGQWDLLGFSGVSAMHATLIPNTNKIVFLEKVEKNSHAHLPEDPSKFSWSVEFDIEESTFRSLHTKSNMFCSAGGYRPDGTIVSLGGAEAQSNIVEGWNSLRFLSACNSTKSKCDWDTRDNIVLTAGRWYPSVETLADGRLFIFGGATRGASMNSEEISVPSWELYPPLPTNPTRFPFLEETLPYNLYPNNYEPEILICGGATDFASKAKGQDQCGRIRPLSKNPDWVMEDMPLGRMMPDMCLLPDGSVMILNGANRGTAGYGRANDPVLSPVRYQTWDSAQSRQQGSRFTLQRPSYIPRLYHSIAMPVLDGRVMVAGSNPNANSVEWGEFPVEYRVEMFSPGYMFTDVPRPLLKAGQTIGRTVNKPTLSLQARQTQKLSPEQGQGDGNTSENVIAYDTVFEIEVEFYASVMTESQVVTPKADANNNAPSRVQVNLYNGGFVTHSTHMSQRLVGLEIVGYVVNHGHGLDRLKVRGPKNGALTPPGWYQMTVVENGVPSEGVWVRVLQKE
ncbi:hypothetical protein CPC16_007963 [Podila verticillata]|nr:hypothetical protein CPC16_007963 [Podila verticillata]